MKFKLGQRIRHTTEGHIYRVVDLPTRCRIETTNEPAYTFTRVDGSDITLWVLPANLMEDGRFVPANA